MASRRGSGSAGRGVAGLALTGLALLGCGAPGQGTGEIAVALRWFAPEPAGTRGVLSGIVDTVRLEARRGGQTVVETRCAYETYTCDLLEVPARSGYTVRAEGLVGLQAAFRGESDPLVVADGQVTAVDVAMEAVYPVDVYAPAAVDDLAGVWLTASGELELTWTSTGDDGRLGLAELYDIRWSLASIDEANFAAANNVDGPTPRVPGSAERLTLRGGLPSGEVHVRLEVLDDAAPPNASGLSNEAVVTVP